MVVVVANRLLGGLRGVADGRYDDVQRTDAFRSWRLISRQDIRCRFSSGNGLTMSLAYVMASPVEANTARRQTPSAEDLRSLAPPRHEWGNVAPCTNTDPAMTANVRWMTCSLNGAGSPWTIAYAR